MSMFPWLDYLSAPSTLNQPILPGWSFMTINETNSSAPDTEQRILAGDSYGRQIGRLTDVVELLLAQAEATDPELKKTEAVEKLKEVTDRVKGAKAEADKARQDRLVGDLLALKKQNQARFDAVIKAVSI